MNAYVAVTNDVSLAVKSMLQVKKAYRTQMKCHDDLTLKNKELQQRIYNLEKKNEDLDRKLAKLQSDNHNKEKLVSELKKHIVSDLIVDCTGADVFNEMTVVDNNSMSKTQMKCVIRETAGVNVNSQNKGQSLCPTSPTTSNKQGSKRKATPKKQILPRKSARLSNRA